MGLLKYIEMKSLSGVNLTSRHLVDHETNILDPTQGACCESGPSGVQPEMSGSCSKRKKLEKSDDDANLQFKRSDKRPGKKIVFSDSESEADHDTGARTVNTTVPDAPVSSRKRRSGKRKFISEPGESSDEVGQTNTVPESDLEVLDQVGCLAQLVGSVPDLVTSWYARKAKREARLRDRVSRYRVRMTVQAAKNTKLTKKVRKLKSLKTAALEKGQEAIRMLAKNTIDHAKVVDSLKTELEIARAKSVESELKLKQSHEEIQQQKEMVQKLKQVNKVETGKWEVAAEGWRQERVSLEESLERVSTDRRWLIKEGFGYVINRLHKSQEYNEPLAAVESNFWEWGAHYGLVKGYESCKEGVGLEDVPLYKPQAHRKFLKAVHELEHARFPYVVALSQCADRSLDELRALEPIGLEEDGGDQ